MKPKLRIIKCMTKYMVEKYCGWLWVDDWFCLTSFDTLEEAEHYCEQCANSGQVLKEYF